MTDLQGAGAPPHPVSAPAAAAAGASAGDDATAHAALGALRARVLAAAASRTPLRVRGGGTKDFYGQAFDGDVLDTRAYRGIVSFEPTELVVTARCGTPLSELQAVLAEHRQIAAVVNVGMGQQHCVKRVWWKRQLRPILQPQLLPALKQSAVDQHPVVTGLQKILRPSDGAGGTKKLQTKTATHDASRACSRPSSRTRTSRARAPPGMLT